MTSDPGLCVCLFSVVCKILISIKKEKKSDYRNREENSCFFVVVVVGNVESDNSSHIILKSCRVCPR